MTDAHHIDTPCERCGKPTVAYRGGAGRKLCEDCKAIAKRERNREYRNAKLQLEEQTGIVVGEGIPKWKLIDAPDRDLWGSVPVFSLEEIDATFGHYGKIRYHPKAEYVFPHGCVFEHIYSHKRRVVNVKDGYIRLVREA